MQNKELIIDNLISIWQEKGVTKLIPAEGKSMYPLIKQGDNIKIRFSVAKDIKIGEIAAFKRNNITIVHRLIKRKGHYFIEKGDFQIKGNLVMESDIFGKIEMQNKILNNIMSAFGYIIYKLGYISKPLLIIPFIINAGTRIYLKLRAD